MAGEAINWYETAAMKKHLQYQEPYPFDATQIKVNSRILVCGTSGSGKTSCIATYLEKSPNTFAHIIVVHKEAEAIYDMLQEELEGAITFYTDLGKLPTLKKLREKMDKDERILLVIDDWVTDLHKFPNVKDYFIYGRRQQIQIMCLVQSYYTTPKVLRSQMSYLLLFKITSKKDLNLILSDHLAGDLDIADVKQLYEDATDSNLDFFKINCNTCPLNEKYSKNFTGFYKID